MMHFTKQKGYTLLFSIIVAVTVLGIAAFIVSISKKQFLLSSNVRDSMYSIYTANRGIECVIYSMSQVRVNSGDPQTFPCNGKTITLKFRASETSNGTYVSNNAPILFDDNGGCAIITVTLSKDTSGNSIRTFNARGYNVTCVVDTSGLNATSTVTTRATERAIAVTFKSGPTSPITP